MKPYPLPSGWRWARLGDLCEINPSRPRNFQREYSDLTSLVPMSAVDEKKGIIRLETVPYSEVSKGYTFFAENDVLFAKITPCMQNGKHMIARSLVDGIGFGTTEFHVLRPGKDILPEWVWYFIRRECFLQEATTYFTGVVGQQRVPENFLANHNIPCPSLSVQKHLVAKLKEKDEKSNSISIAAKRQLDNINVIPETILNRAFKGEL
jgi:type I restriction enzyme S subunit